VAHAPVVVQRHCPVALPRDRRRVELQQALVDRPQVPLGQVAIVHEFAVDARQFIERRLEPGVTDGIARQEGMPRGIEQPAIEGRDVERRAAPVDDLEERL
jgi:hypothetical protein